MEKYVLNLTDWEIISVTLTHGWSPHGSVRSKGRWPFCACSLHVKIREANSGGQDPGSLHWDVVAHDLLFIKQGEPRDGILACFLCFDKQNQLRLAKPSGQKQKGACRIRKEREESESCRTSNQTSFCVSHLEMTKTFQKPSLRRGQADCCRLIFFVITSNFEQTIAELDSCDALVQCPFLFYKRHRSPQIRHSSKVTTIPFFRACTKLPAFFVSLLYLPKASNFNHLPHFPPLLSSAFPPPFLLLSLPLFPPPNTTNGIFTLKETSFWYCTLDTGLMSGSGQDCSSLSICIS